MLGFRIFNYLVLAVFINIAFLSVGFAQTAKELEGDWIVKGYQCDGKTEEQRIRIAASADQLTAIKVTGDVCVPTGEITWKGEVGADGTISGTAQQAEPGSHDYKWVPVSLTIVNAAEITGGELFSVMHKIEACRTPGADGILASNDFLTGREGWQVSGDVALRHGALPDYLSDGGYLGAEDEAVGGVWYFDAPRAYSGNLSCAYGGEISFDLKQPHLNRQFKSPDVEIKGRAGVLTFTFPDPPGTTWTKRKVPLSVEAEWYANGVLATRNEMKNILASVQKIRIRGEYITGPDYGELDNVVLLSGKDDPVEFGEVLDDPGDEEETTISGRVIYARNEAPVDLATVLLTNTDTGAFIAGEPVKRETDARFNFTALKPGNYTVSVSDAYEDYEAFSISETVEDLEEGDHANVELVLEPAKINVSGTVYALDAKNTPQPIKNATVVVEFSNGEKIETYSNDSGAFWANYEEVPPDTYTVYVRLQDKDGIINVRSVSGFQGEIVDLKTKQIDITKPQMQTNVFFSWNFKLTDPSYIASKKFMLRHAGAFYVNSMKAVDFARDVLIFEFDYKLPVDQYLYAPTIVAQYLSDKAIIEIPVGNGGSLVTSGNSPTNREFHEFGHHVNADSELTGENKPFFLSAGDISHGGANNSNSTDSIREGFAEFFAMMINGNPSYKYGGSVANLQMNFHSFSNGEPTEEFNLASLLWDLADSDNEKGDYFSLGYKGAWDALNNEAIHTIHGLYEVLEEKYGLQDTNPKDGLSDLDALFVLHRFFSDTNTNGAHDSGEKIGYADYYKSQTSNGNDPRENVPREPGTLLAFTMVEMNTDIPLEVPYFITTVFYEDDQPTFSYEQLPEQEDSRISVIVPYGAFRVEIKPMIPGYNIDPYSITPEKFKAQVIGAKEQELDFYASYDFVAHPNNIPVPEDVVATMEDGIVRLSWASDNEVILVRGIEKQPLSQNDGEIIFEGIEREITDTGALFFEGATAYYTIFTRGRKDQVSKSVFASVELSQPQPVSSKTSSPSFLLVGGLILGIGLVLFIIYRRRRK